MKRAPPAAPATRCPAVMIMGIFGRYPSKLPTIMKRPAPPAAKLHAVSGRTLLNRAAKLHTVCGTKPLRRGGSDGSSGRDRPGQDGPAHRQEPDGARLPRHR